MRWFGLPYTFERPFLRGSPISVYSDQAQQRSAAPVTQLLNGWLIALSPTEPFLSGLYKAIVHGTSADL